MTKTTPCCPLNKSVFVGGQLNGKGSQEIKDFISTKFSVGVSHVLKTLDKSYGHVHFETENEAGTLYQRVQGQEFTFPDGTKTSFLPSKMAGSSEFTVYKIENESSHGNGSRTILVTLNVGGVLYTTTKGTLLKKTNFFEMPLNGNVFDTLDYDGNIFIDRNGELLKYVLEFLRTSVLPKRTLHNKSLLEELLLEAEFYHIEELHLAQLCDKALIAEDEIQRIMDHFSNKPSIDFSDDQDNSINDDSSSVGGTRAVVTPIPQPNNPIHDQAYFRNKVLKLYSGISFSCSNDRSEDVYHCKTKSSLCPSCETNHIENIVGRYMEGSYHIG
ncbi:4882_t:CDS:2, partial [Funneliformis geosporum]